MTTPDTSQTDPDHPGPDYISLSELRRAGHNSRIIRQTLGLPDRSNTSHPFPKSPNRHYYRRSRAHETTQGRRFQLTRLSNLLQSLARGERRLSETLQWAQSAPLTTNLPSIPWQELAEHAIIRRFQRQGRFHLTQRETAQDPRTLPAYLCLKHDHTNYDELCNQVWGRPFGKFAYPLLLHRVNRAILDAYPECLPRVKGLHQDPSFTCPTCRATAPGVYNGHYYEKPPGWLYRASSTGRAIRAYCTRACTYPNPNHHRAPRNPDNPR